MDYNYKENICGKLLWINEGAIVTALITYINDLKGGEVSQTN